MRGTPVSCQFSWHGWGIIPTYAGNTPDYTDACNYPRDHPRVCGEHLPALRLLLRLRGSSPRMRGTHALDLLVDLGDGIIPAYAGNTTILERAKLIGTGSSPRMRGTLILRSLGRCLRWIIPAYAGNTSASPCRPNSVRDHPRVCGEHPADAGFGMQCKGSSPRMRGTLVLLSTAGELDGIIPAYAGNTNELVELVVLKGDHPRVCGEHRPVMGRAAHRRGSSPRMRGTRCGARERQDIGGIIPAYAGNT